MAESFRPVLPILLYCISPSCGGDPAHALRTTAAA
jgi:hypothetical protein